MQSAGASIGAAKCIRMLAYARRNAMLRRQHRAASWRGAVLQTMAAILHLARIRNAVAMAARTVLRRTLSAGAMTSVMASMHHGATALWLINAGMVTWRRNVRTKKTSWRQ